MISFILYGVIGLIVAVIIVKKIKYNNRIKKYAAEHNITIEEAKQFFKKKEKAKEEKEEKENQEESPKKKPNAFVEFVVPVLVIVAIVLILWFAIKFAWA